MLRYCHWRFPPSLAAARMLSSPPPPHSHSTFSSGGVNSSSIGRNSKPELLFPQSHPQNISSSPSSSLKSTVDCSSAGAIRRSMATNSQCFTSKPESNESHLGSLVVVSFYKFANFPDHADFRKPLKDLCEESVCRFFYLIQNYRYLIFKSFLNFIDFECCIEKEHLV